MVRWNQGRATWGVWGGVTPPKKSKKGGPNLRGGGSDMLELQFFLKMKDFFAENFGNFWKKVVLQKISGTFVFEKITSTSPPGGGPEMGGGWNGRGPKFWNTPPQPETGWHGPGWN